MQTRRAMCAALTLFAALSFFPPFADAVTPIPASLKLAAFYDGLGVENRWIAGQHIDWETGDPDGRPERSPGRHTHCSAFVAAAAERLGIYILRPPEHGQILLANAQNAWLAGPGKSDGWRRLDDAAQAQQAADRGLFVVASYRNHDDDRPGHIAIVRPGGKAAAILAQDGPDIIQAGSHNSTKIGLRQGFAGHPHAWADGGIDYYAHDIPAGRL